VPWEVSIPDDEKEPQLLAKLEGELEGIVAWVVRRCLEWQRKGLASPAEVEASTDEYQVEQDVLAGFTLDRYVEGPELSVKSGPLCVAYKKW
jgi:putative DNA primase/helicase